MPPYRAALTSQSRCLFPAQLDSEQSRRISTMGKSLPPKPPDDAPTVSIERALINAKLNEEMSRLRRLEAEQVEAKARVAALRGELAADRSRDSGDPTSPPRTAREKVSSSGSSFGDATIYIRLDSLARRLARLVTHPNARINS